MKIRLVDEIGGNDVPLSVTDESWCHISIGVKNNNVSCILNGEVIESLFGFKPQKIVIETEKDTFWKIHDCEYTNMETVTLSLLFGDFFRSVYDVGKSFGWKTFNINTEIHSC
jgi:hypothetical protein